MTDYITVPASNFQAVSHLRRHIVDTKGFIAGGVFKNIFNGEPVKDIDVFFPSQKAWAKAKKVLKKKGYKKVYSNARVVAYVDPITKVRVELIGAPELTDAGFENDSVNYAEHEDTIRGFDFTITKFALWLKSGDVIEDEPDEWMVTYHPEFFEHLHLKRLVIDADLVKPFSTFERTLRYTSYGYKMCRESKATLIRQIQETEFESDAQLSASFYEGID